MWLAEFSGRLKKVNERRDDTTKPETESRPARGEGGYYYDDSTGYETYRPEDGEGEGDTNEEGEGDEGEPESGRVRGGGGKA